MVLIEYYNAVPGTTFVVNLTNGTDITFAAVGDIHDLSESAATAVLNNNSEHFRAYSWTVWGGWGGWGAVSSVFGRTWAVVAASGDYDDGDVTAAGTATNYTPIGATVEWHLAGIDTALWAVSGATNLAYTASTTDGTVTSDTGTDATVPAGSTTTASLMLPADKTKVDHISVTQAVDLDAIPSAADATTASDDNTGDGGSATTYARSDHKHIAQWVSADAEQLLTVWSDGLHMLNPDDMLSADPDNMLIKGTDGKLTASLDAATIWVPWSWDYVLWWTNGTLTVFPK